MMHVTSDRSNNQTPLGFLLGVMRDPAQPMAIRMRAAIALLPYTNAKKRYGSDDAPSDRAKAPAPPPSRTKSSRRLSLVKP